MQKNMDTSISDQYTADFLWGKVTANTGDWGLLLEPTTMLSRN
jgi:hypothetical protein